MDHTAIGLGHDPRHLDSEPTVGLPRLTEREPLCSLLCFPSTKAASGRGINPDPPNPPRLGRLAHVHHSAAAKRSHEYLSRHADGLLVDDVIPSQAEELARRSWLTRETVRSVERGDADVMLSTVEQLALALGVAAGALLRRASR
jgi:hypothetical protein